MPQMYYPCEIRSALQQLVLCKRRFFYLVLDSLLNIWKFPSMLFPTKRHLHPLMTLHSPPLDSNCWFTWQIPSTLRSSQLNRMNQLLSIHRHAGDAGAIRICDYSFHRSYISRRNFDFSNVDTLMFDCDSLLCKSSHIGPVESRKYIRIWQKKSKFFEEKIFFLKEMFFKMFCEWQKKICVVADRSHWLKTYDWFFTRVFGCTTESNQ